jgi:hypothetical protein
MPQQKIASRKNLSVLVACGLGLGWAGFGKTIRETVQLAQYQPPAAVEQLAKATEMSETGRRIFYLFTPTIEDQKVGLNSCKTSDAEKTIILGCYVSNRGIFIQQVTDRRLAGVMEVTAAHEMLHAAYYRLSESERRQVDAELQQVFKSLKNDRLKSLIELYRQRDPRVVNSELHSILGTEELELSPFLEQYYQRYFTRRATVVAFAKSYEQPFNTLTTQAAEIERQIEAMKVELKRLDDLLVSELSRINEQKGEVAQAQSGSEYQSKVESINQQVVAYNQHVEYMKQQNEVYQQLVYAYNALYQEEESLNNSLKNNNN